MLAEVGIPSVISFVPSVTVNPLPELNKPFDMKGFVADLSRDAPVPLEVSDMAEAGDVFDIMRSVPLPSSIDMPLPATKPLVLNVGLKALEMRVIVPDMRPAVVNVTRDEGDVLVNVMSVFVLVRLRPVLTSRPLVLNVGFNDEVAIKVLPVPADCSNTDEAGDEFVIVMSVALVPSKVIPVPDIKPLNLKFGGMVELSKVIEPAVPADVMLTVEFKNTSDVLELEVSPLLAMMPFI